MISAVLIITFAYCRGCEPRRVPAPTLARCEEMKRWPGVWWTLRPGLELRCEPEVPA
jgi:hypothetical protein